MLNESLAPRDILSEGLKYHMDANKPLTEHLYRAGSDSYFNLWAEARSLYSREILEITHKDDLAVLTETDLGHFGMFEGKKVPLDFPMLDEGTYEEGGEDDRKYALLKVRPENYNLMIDKLQDMNINHTRHSGTEGVIKVYTDRIPDKVLYRLTHDVWVDKFVLKEAEYQGREVPLNKPKRGGPKKFFVYVKNPKTGNVKKVNFGDSGNLSVKIKEPGARASFAARHKCAQKKDKTKAGYWSCNIGRYWKSLGGSKNFSGYW